MSGPGGQHRSGNGAPIVLSNPDGSVVSPDFPLPTIDYDDAHRVSTNTVFGDKIVGTRVPSISSQFQYGVESDAAVIDTVGSGVVDFVNSMLQINTGTDPNGAAGIQSSDYLHTSCKQLSTSRDIRL
jgi:hypothetical protein